MKKLIAIIVLVCLWAATPLLRAQTIETYTFTTNRLVPDGNAAGLSDVRNINSAIGVITSLSVNFKLTGEFNGDLYVYLRHSTGYTVLLNRPGKTGGNAAGYADSGFDVTFQDVAAHNVHLYQNYTTPAAGSPLSGAWQPDGRAVDPTNVTDASSSTTPLSNFNGLNAAGEWTLYVSDVESGGTNMVTEWSLQIAGQATPTLAWAKPADITYGTALDGTQLNATATYNSTNVPGTFAYSPDTGAVLNAGNNQTLSVTFTPTDTTGFLSTGTNVAINVQKAPLNITANSTNKVYGADLPVFTAGYSGFVNSDTASSLTTAVTLGTAASKSSAVGTYAITATGAASANYAITEVGGNLTNTPASLTITANNTNKIYGADNPTFTASYSGFTNSDNAASLTTPVSLTTTANAASPAGPYTITPSGAVDANYTIGYVNGTLTVGTATLIVTADNQSKAYGAALPTLTASYSGFVNSDTTNSLTALATVTTTATPTSDPGPYSITASGASSPNYSFSYVAGSLSVTNSLTTGIVTSSANPALPGASVTFSMAVAAVAPGVGTPTGSVNFRIDGSIAGSGSLSGGAATYNTSSLTHGTHAVVAEYAGSTDFYGVTNSLSPVENINTPPVAGSDTISRYAMQGVKVRLSTLLAKASDTDNDTLGISVSSTSANAGTITTSGAWVFYTPASGFTNADSFTYTITDGHGGSSSGTVTVAILADDAVGQNLVITDQGGGSFLVKGSGIPGRTYRMQYTDSFSPTAWTDFSGGSVTANSTGAFQFTDTSGSSGRYYRSVYP